ncbi:MAG TPA: PIN domain-containing protein [Candidatus Binatia bacterium]|jgi:predicted nucleic acid-binding protein|nr:PIN domain-containing protein [Candidatus Binatia bacterium]
MRLYLDAAPIIYAVEQVAPFFPVVDARLSTAGVVLVASDLTRMECRVKPVREGNADLLKDYDDFFAYAVAETAALSREIMDRATEIRARYGFKTPDAVHLGAAVVTSCDAFLTNDHRLDRFPDISIEVVGS